MGAAVGMIVGSPGPGEGRKVGHFEGITVGTIVGKRFILEVGAAVGEAVGNTLRAVSTVGASDGATVGSGDGS